MADDGPPWFVDSDVPPWFEKDYDDNDEFEADMAKSYAEGLPAFSSREEYERHKQWAIEYSEQERRYLEIDRQEGSSII